MLLGSACPVSCACKRCAPESPYTSLEDFRRSICKLSVFSFNGWEYSKLAQTKQARRCELLVGENISDVERVGRADIRRALRDAEETFLHELGYPIVPTWFTTEIRNHKWPCQSRGPTGLLTVPNTPLMTLGIEHYQVVATLKRVPDSLGNDEYKLRMSTALNMPDKFTVKVTVPMGAKPEEIKLYFGPSERYESDLEDRRWEIPVDSVRISPDWIATITGHSALLAKPELQASTVPHPQPISEAGDFGLDPTYLPNYAEELEVRFVYVSPCGGINAHIPANHCGCPSCGGQSNAHNCGHCQRVGFCIENATSGIIRPLWHGAGLGGAMGVGCGRLPDKFCVNYLAGDCSRDWTREISALAAARLGCPVCTCGNDGLSYWREDIALNEKRQKTFDQLNEARLGTRLGEILASQTINRYRRDCVGQF